MARKRGRLVRYVNYYSGGMDGVDGVLRKREISEASERRLTVSRWTS